MTARLSAFNMWSISKMLMKKQILIRSIWTALKLRFGNNASKLQKYPFWDVLRNRCFENAIDRLVKQVSRGSYFSSVRSLQRRLLEVNYDLLKIAECLFNRTTFSGCFWNCYNVVILFYLHNPAESYLFRANNSSTGKRSEKTYVQS